MLEPLTNAQIRKFKAAAQLMEPMLKVGKSGLSDGFVRTVSEALDQHELVKIKFAEFKEQKKELVRRISKDFEEVVNVKPESLHILFQDIDKEDWGTRGALASDL